MPHRVSEYSLHNGADLCACLPARQGAQPAALVARQCAMLVSTHFTQTHQIGIYGEQGRVHSNLSTTLQSWRGEAMRMRELYGGGA